MPVPCISFSLRLFVLSVSVFLVLTCFTIFWKGFFFLLNLVECQGDSELMCAGLCPMCIKRMGPNLAGVGRDWSQELGIQARSFLWVEGS